MANGTYREIIPMQIVKLRKTNSLTQQQFADKLGVSKQTVSNWENGVKFPRMKYLEKIAHTFNIATSYLINDEDSEMEDIKETMKTIEKMGESLIKLGEQTKEHFPYLNLKKILKEENVYYEHYYLTDDDKQKIDTFIVKEILPETTPKKMDSKKIKKEST